MQLHDLEAARVELGKLARAESPRSNTSWSIYKTLMHCAQSIDASRLGYPKLKPALVRKTIGKLVLRRFFANGAMSHDKQSPVPGADDIAADGALGDALAVLERSIEAFLAHQGPLEPHFVFDVLSKDDYERLHAMHLADHLSEMHY